MKKKWNIVIARFLIVLFFISIGGTGSAVYAAVPNDENYDDDAGYSNATTQFTVDEIKYTLTGPGPDTLVTNVAPSGWGELGDGGWDNFISIMGIDTLKIEAADGSYFKLNGFKMGFCSVTGITITPEAGAAITRARAGDESYYSIDVSANTDFQYIRYFTISGTDMIMNIDDLDFSPAVPPTHTVTYNGNGNTGGVVPTDGSSPYTEGDTVTVLGNTGTLVKTGYSFAGWNTAANGSGDSYAPAATFAMGSGNVTLYAQWTENTYSVTYNGNSNTGGSAPTDATSYHNGDTAPVLGNTGTLVRTGYNFAGWNTAANGSGTSYTGGNTFAIAGSNVTLYAQWTAVDYTVTYDGNTNTGGAVPTDGTSYHTTDTATVLGNTGNLVRTGYTFVGWNTLANGTGTDYAPSATFAIGSSNVTLYAKWTENVYTVTYSGNSNTGGAVPTDGISYHTTNTATVLGNTGSLVRTGYTFAGWNTLANGSGTSYTGGDTFVIASSNVTLYAQWTAVDYTVTYDGNTNTGGAVPTDGTSYHTTDTATVLGNTGSLVRTGYTFAGWNTLANGTGTDYAPAATFAIGSSHVILYAKWTSETTAPSLTAGAVTRTSDTVGTVKFTSNEAGSYYYAVVADGVGEPVIDTSGVGTVCTTAETIITNPTGLTAGAKDIYIKVKDAAGNVSNALKIDIPAYVAPDTTKPVLSSASASETSHNATTLNFTSDEAGIYYYLVYSASDSEPSAATVKAQGTAVTKGTSTALPSANAVSVTGLMASTSYKAYVVVKDAANNVSNVSTIPFTTTAAPDTTKPILTAGAVSRTSDTAGTVKFASNEAGQYYYAVVADGAGEPTIVTTGVGTSCTTAETTITNPTGLTAGAKDIYIKVKDAAGNVSNALKIDIAAYVAPSSSSSGSGGSSTTVSSGTGTVNVIVNGKTENAGTETKSTENGKSTVTVAVSNKTIESKIEEAVKTNTGQQNVIQVPVADTKSDVVKVELTGDIVKQLETNTFDVSVKRDSVEYVIPAKELTISNVAKELGVKEQSLKDIKVQVKITKLEDSVVAKYNEVAKENGATIVFPPTAFEVVAKTTTAEGKTEDVKINKFSNYVERVMEIPSGVDPSKITTGIVFNADGTYSHVPTEVYQSNGKWYAKLSSLTNSNYSVVWNPVTVKSVEKHWAKSAVNDMASRLVIFNAETFEPNKAITRADFAEYIVRALGLYRQGTYENKFKDVSATGDRTLAVLIANEYGIVTGYSDGTFKGDNQITREEAMTMYQRAMKVTKLTGTDTSRYQSYTDYTKVSGWATNYVKEVLSAHVFNGTTATTISPKASLTYAESAQAIKNLLVESKLINK